MLHFRLQRTDSWNIAVICPEGNPGLLREIQSHNSHKSNLLTTPSIKIWHRSATMGLVACVQVDWAWSVECMEHNFFSRLRGIIYITL